MLCITYISWKGNMHYAFLIIYKYIINHLLMIMFIYTALSHIHIKQGLKIYYTYIHTQLYRNIQIDSASYIML